MDSVCREISSEKKHAIASGLAERDLRSVFLCVLASVNEGMSVHLSVNPSVRPLPIFFKCAKTRLFYSRDRPGLGIARREVIERGRGGKDGGDEATREGATREEASEEITRGTHLTAVYPALFHVQANVFLLKSFWPIFMYFSINNQHRVFSHWVNWKNPLPSGAFASHFETKLLQITIWIEFHYKEMYFPSTSHFQEVYVSSTSH